MTNRNLNQALGRRRRIEMIPSKGLDVIFDPTVAVRRVSGLLRTKETVYAVGVVQKLDHPLIVQALENLDGVQLLTSGKSATRAFHMRNFRCFRGPQVRSLGTLRCTCVQGNYLIGLSGSNKVQWVYTGFPLVKDGSAHIGDALILYGENGIPYANEYLKLFELSRV